MLHLDDEEDNDGVVVILIVFSLAVHLLIFLTSHGTSLMQEKFAKMISEAGFNKVEYENLVGGVVAIHSGLKL